MLVSDMSDVGFFLTSIHQTYFVVDDGSMNQKRREISLQRIRDDDSIRIILISFKAGGSGLNLTACNNVILVDLWWNPALEVCSIHYSKLASLNLSRSKRSVEFIGTDKNET